MTKSLQEWKNQVWNKTIDLDNQSFDCVDVSKHWIGYLSDVGWQQSAGWGNAKDIYANWYTTYLEKIPRGNPPKLGDIVVMNGQVGGGYGHTGVVVGIDGQNITIYQQNTFTQQPIYEGIFNAYVSYITGFLRPKIPFTINNVIEPYQRVASYAAKYRDQPNSSATLLQTFVVGETYDFKGWVRGENVDGNDVWFVGRYTGGYAWSGAFDDKGTHDLTDLNPQPDPLKGFQRIVGNSIINYRKEPKIMPDNVIKTFDSGDILDFDAWTRGANVDGNDIWFRGRYTGGWSHSGGFTDQTTHDLTEVTDTVVPAPEVPIYPPSTVDPEVTKVYNKKHPIDNTYSPIDLENNNGQQLRKEANTSMKLMQGQQSLILASGYRSYNTQVKVYQQNVDQLGQVEADRVSARPGYSEHQTGLTMDFGPIDDSFAGSSTYTWLSENAFKYGWILRYPANKETVTGYMYEPWHWRYVGATVATDMRVKGITTLEEYYNIEGGDYSEDSEPADPFPSSNFLIEFLKALADFIKNFIDDFKKKQ